MDVGFTYSFPALRGIQAGREYYVAMCPLKLIPKIFLFDEDEVPPDFRAQRVVNKNRIPEIAEYILANPKDYVFSSLTASIDGNVTFKPFDKSEEFPSIGKLLIPMDSRFLINDGQHRRAAIEEALKINPDLGSETISVVFYRDEELRRSQQMFSDLNRHAVNTTRSIGILYDSRDALALLTKQVIDTNDILRALTDKENSSLSKFSPKLFTLSNIYSANTALLALVKGDDISAADAAFVTEYWRLITAHLDEWAKVKQKEMTAHDLRLHFIHSNGIVLEAFGHIGNYLYRNNVVEWPAYVARLAQIDWSRTNDADWLDRVYNHRGRINKNSVGIKLTTNRIKMLIGLPLSLSEQTLEAQFTESRRGAQ